MADKADTGKAGPATVAAGEGMVGGGAAVSRFFLRTLLAARSILWVSSKGGHSLVNGLTPGIAIGGKNCPLAVVDVASSEGFLQQVLVPFLWSPSGGVARGQLSIEHHLQQAVTLHPGYKSSPT